MTPWQLGCASTILRALAQDDQATLANWVKPGIFGGVFGGDLARIRAFAANGWCREALAPWGNDALPGPRTKMIREDGGGSMSLVRFAERGARVLVLDLRRDASGAKLRDVCEMDRSAFDAFGKIV